MPDQNCTPTNLHSENFPHRSVHMDARGWNTAIQRQKEHKAELRNPPVLLLNVDGDAVSASAPDLPALGTHNGRVAEFRWRINRARGLPTSPYASPIDIAIKTNIRTSEARRRSRNVKASYYPSRSANQSPQSGGEGRATDARGRASKISHATESPYFKKHLRRAVDPSRKVANFAQLCL